MDHSVSLAWWHTRVLTKRRYELLLDRWGDLERAAAHVDLSTLRALGCREETARKALHVLRTFDADCSVRELEAHDVAVRTLEDAEYPSLLKEIHDPPVFLSFRGDPSILTRPRIALVGTRAMSAYGKRVTGALTQPLVAAGFVTVSGLAHGIDAEVARATLAAGGKTVAVLGNGLFSVHPSGHRALADEIVTGGGVLLSELPPRTKPEKFTFPARNRIIAGLSRATVILEAAEGSGSLITAELALDYDRDVFAVPGQMFDTHYRGCHALIAGSGARIVSGPEDLLAALGVLRTGRTRCDVPSFDSEDEECVYGALTGMPQSLDDLSTLAINTPRISAALTYLQLKGAAENVGDGKWVRS